MISQMQKEKNNDIIFSKAKLAFSMAVFGTIGIFVRNIPFPSGFIAMSRKS